MCKYQSRLNAPRQPGFTLIELLLVISIIALLISLLLPALQAAKRRVKVLTCLTNFKTVGIGLEVYVNENNNKYPGPPFDQWGGAIYDASAGPAGTNPDGRVNFFQISGERPSEILWCPLLHIEGPVYDGKDEWSRHYLSCRSQCWQPGGMWTLFLFNDGAPWTWEKSGNPDIDGDGRRDGPWEPGHSEAATVTDVNWWWPPQCPGADGVKSVCGSVHTSVQGRGGAYMKFIDSNVLYGDGHAVSRNVLANWVTRTDGNLHMY